MIFICFNVFWFNSNLWINRFIELSSELGAPIIDWGQNFFRFGDFPIRSFKFMDRSLVSFRCIPVYLLSIYQEFLRWNTNTGMWFCVILVQKSSLNKAGISIEIFLRNMIIFWTVDQRAVCRIRTLAKWQLQKRFWIRGKTFRRETRNAERFLKAQNILRFLTLHFWVV